MVRQQVVAHIVRDDEVENASITAVNKRRVMDEPVHGLVGTIAIRPQAGGIGAQGRARRWVYQRRKLRIPLGVFYSPYLRVLGGPHADILRVDILSVGDKALVDALVHAPLNEVPYEVCHYLIHLSRPRIFISKRPGWMLLTRSFALRKSAFFFFLARPTIYSCTPNLASRIAYWIYA